MFLKCFYLFRNVIPLPKFCDFQVLWENFVTLKRGKPNCSQKVRFKILVYYIALQDELIRSVIAHIKDTISQQARNAKFKDTDMHSSEIKLLYIIFSL
jgi:hypothetical protein